MSSSGFRRSLPQGGSRLRNASDRLERKGRRSRAARFGTVTIDDADRRIPYQDGVVHRVLEDEPGGGRRLPSDPTISTLRWSRRRPQPRARRTAGAAGARGVESRSKLRHRWRKAPGRGAASVDRPRLGLRIHDIVRRTELPAATGPRGADPPGRGGPRALRSRVERWRADRLSGRRASSRARGGSARAASGSRRRSQTRPPGARAIGRCRRAASIASPRPRAA